MQAEQGATLIPAINAGIWEQGISTRLVLFSGWVEDGEHCSSRHLRFVGIQKLHGKAHPVVVDDEMDNIYAFDIQPVSLRHSAIQILIWEILLIWASGWSCVCTVRHCEDVCSSVGYTRTEEEAG